VSFVNVFQLTHQEIQALHELDLVRLVNRLLWHEGWRERIPPSEIRISLRINDPDGGVDALTNASERGGRFLETGLRVWQFKKTWRAKGDLEAEVRKPAVQDAFRVGAGYTLVIGENRPARTLDRWQRELRQIATMAGCTGTVRLLDAEQVARWASAVPSALLELRSQLRGFYRADLFIQREPIHAIPFEVDAARRATVEAIRQSLFGSNPSVSHARIQGAAGVGKTRLALELVRELGLDTLTLYGANVPSSAELFDWVAANEEIEAIVIIDECEDAQAIQLETLTHQCQGRLRLITIGLDSTHRRSPYVLTALERDAMERVVRAAATILTEEQVRWVAEKTQGYVKLGVAVAQGVASSNVSIGQMQTESEIHRIITRLVVPGEEAQLALKGVALLTRLGWNGEVADEGRAVARFIGLDWNRMQLALAPAVRDGLVVRRGRYWYVSPELLALWLAAEVWETEAHRLPELLDGLPSQGSRDALLERFTQLGSLPGVRTVLEEVLGDQGPFRDLDTLDNPRLAHLFSTIAWGAPIAAMAALNRIFGSPSPERLQRFGPGRREILWTLERLLERAETFFDAGRLVRQLAEAENESFGNNATGVWSSLFLTFVGPTEVPTTERFTLIEEALAATTPEAKLLALRGISKALQAREVGLGLHKSVDAPRRHWRPETWGVVWQAKRQALAILKRVLADPSAEIQREARKVFIDHAVDLVNQGLGDEVVSWLAELDGADESERREIWNSIRSVLRYSADRLDREQRERIEQYSTRFFGEAFIDRAKRYLGRTADADFLADGKPPEPTLGEIARQLAVEAIEHPDELLALLPWLVSGEAENVWPFARQLGQVDNDRAWLQVLLEVGRSGSDLRILSGYLNGRAEVDGADWRENLLDSWSDDQSLAAAVFDGTVCGPASDRAVQRLGKLVDYGWLEPARLGWLKFGRWIQGVSQRALAEAVSRLMQADTAETTESALALVDDWVDADGRTLAGPLRDLAWQLLERPSGWGAKPMLSFYWKRVALRLLLENPLRLTCLIVRMYLESEPAFRDARLGLLRQTLAVASAEAWGIIGQALLPSPRSYRLMLSLRETDIVAGVPSDVMIPWLQRNGADGARAVAGSLKLEGNPLPELVRWLLKDYSEATAGALTGAFSSGTWWGSEADYWQERAQVARSWQEDREPAVRRWATNLARSLEQQADESRLREEEEAFV
jgi:hypothetical protein